MDDLFFDTKLNTEVKIFSINRNFWELSNIGSSEEIIQFIVDKHRALVKDKKLIGEPLPKNEHLPIVYYSYVYNEKLKDSYWKYYLPSSITDNHNFEIQRLSFTLFAVIEDKIFAIVGGGGIRVIKRFMNSRFGIDFYEYLTSPQDDIITSLTVRGISGRLTEQKEIYREGQTLIDSISFTEIPTKINLKLRDDLKNSIFDFIQFNTEETFIEVGSYFFIKQKLLFNELHELFIQINYTLKNHQSQPLSSFIREKNQTLIEDTYKKILCEELRKDMMNHFYSARSDNAKKFDIDFIHPSKTQDFYECNHFVLKAKNKKKPFCETSNRNALYYEGLKYLYDELISNHSQFDFNAIVFGIRVYGYQDDVLKTEAMFLQHITCEIRHLGTPLFQIDNNWYKVKNDFIETINDRCYNIIEKNLLHEELLTIPWDDDISDEDAYNKAYSGIKDCYVFDKMLGQNIEFCDLMFERDNVIYLVHVKDGFDAKLRDLANQITISANRFINDISSDSHIFLDSVIKSYNNSNVNKLTKNDIVQKFKNSVDIVYIMAFNSRKPSNSRKERIYGSKSNIAKYSLIQCVQEMASVYNIKIFDIADVNS